MPKAGELTEEAIRRMSDKDLDDAIRVAIQELEPGDPLRAQLQSALASHDLGLDARLRASSEQDRVIGPGPAG